MTHYRLPRLVASIALLLLLPAVAMAACAFSPTAPDVLWKFEETAGTALAESVGGTLTATADQHAIVNTPGAYAGSSGFRIPVAEDPSPANTACGATVAWSFPADACMTDGREIIARVTGAADGTAVDFEGSSAFTLSAWVLRDTASNAFAPTHAPIVWQGATTAGPFGFFMTATGVGFQISLGAPTAAFQVVSTNELDDGSWHHLVGVFDGTDLRLYIDGVLDSTDPLTGAPATPRVKPRARRVATTLLRCRPRWRRRYRGWRRGTRRWTRWWSSTSTASRCMPRACRRQGQPTPWPRP